MKKLRKLIVKKQSFPLAEVFRISRGARTESKVIFISIEEDDLIGRAESVPTAHYDETQDSVVAQIESLRTEIESGLSNKQLTQLLTAGAARNAIDCALWDLEAKKKKTSVAKLLGISEFTGCETAQTISIDTVANMSAAADKLKQYPLLKIKFNNQQVIEKMKAIASSAPNSRFIIDANEAWSINQLNQYASALINCRIAIIEQPLSAATDHKLSAYTGKIPLCADESLHTIKDLEKISHLYQFINIKLDKTGGLTEGLKLLKLAKEKQLRIMIGCMVGTSLAMAPAALLTNYAELVDLDGPALLATDREYGFSYHIGQMGGLNPKLWGG